MQNATRATFVTTGTIRRVAQIRALSSLRSRAAGRFCLPSWHPIHCDDRFVLACFFRPCRGFRDCNAKGIPRLAPWAKFFRPSGPEVVAQALAACGSYPFSEGRPADLKTGRSRNALRAWAGQRKTVAALASPRFG